MLRDIGPTNRHVMLYIFFRALSAGLWFNQRQLYLSELGATSQQIGTALTVEALFAGLVMLPAGFLSDRFGPRRVILGALSMGIIGLVLMATAESWSSAIPGLVFYSLTSASSPALLSLVLYSIPDRSIPGISEKVLATVMASWPAAQIVSPWLGGVIAEKTTMRTNLWIAAGIFMIGTVIMLLIKGVELPDKTDSDVDQHIPAALLRNKPFILLVGYFMFVMITVYVGFKLLPSFLQETRGFSLATIGFLFSVSSVGAVVINLISGRSRPRWSFVGLIALHWLAYFVLWQTTDVGWAGVSLFLLGATTATWVVRNACIVQVVREQNRGQAFGIMGLVVFVGEAIAAWMAGQLFDLSPMHDLPLIVGLAGIFIMLVLWFLLRLGPIIDSTGRTK
ncbi:MAG: MFS transporter [Anaerolineaceae bacterium]|nr:MFS transporter [Anaerolineaceae bacterium]